MPENAELNFKVNGNPTLRTLPLEIAKRSFGMVRVLLTEKSEEELLTWKIQMPYPVNLWMLEGTLDFARVHFNNDNASGEEAESNGNAPAEFDPSEWDNTFLYTYKDVRHLMLLGAQYLRFEKLIRALKYLEDHPDVFE